jgi:hypothetical protein
VTPALAQLVDDPEAFRSAWPDRPRVLRSPADIRELLSRDDVRRMIAEPGLRPYQMAMVRNGALTGERPAADHDTDSLGLNGLHTTWPPIIDFCRALAAELGHHVTGNAYLTPPGSKGYGPHWDTHHVWLAQVEGAKHWRINRPVFADPLERHRWTAIGFTDEQREAVTTGEPDFEITLKAGEVLWIPRGWVHHGWTEKEHSLHITFGVQLLTRHWLVERLADAAADDPRFREALPPGLSGAEFDRTIETVTSTLDEWTKEADLRKVGHAVWLEQQNAMLGQK